MTRTKAKSVVSNNATAQTSSSSNSSMASNSSASDISTNQPAVINCQPKEKVLCYHGPMLYTATILETQIRTIDDEEGGNTSVYYKVHYHGWKAKWDEWVPANRVLKMTEENVDLQKILTEELNNRPSAVAARARAASLNEAAIAAVQNEVLTQNQLDETKDSATEVGLDATTTTSIPTQQENYSEESGSKPTNDPAVSTKEPNGVSTTKTTAASTMPGTRGRKRKQVEDVTLNTMVPTSTASPTTTTTTTTTAATVTATTAAASTNHNNSKVAVNNQVKKPKKCKINILVTDDMKLRLIDDWEWITNEYQLVPLPKERPVNVILNDFLDYKVEETEKVKTAANGTRPRGRGRPAKNPHEEALRELLNGLKGCFNEFLGTHLLYRAERQQLYDLRERKGDFEYSSVYGAEHLMRLLVALPQHVEAVDMREAKAEQIREICQDLVWFLESRTETYFATIYENATPMYIRLSENF